MTIILTGEPRSTSTIYKYHCKFGFPSGYMSKEGKDLKESYQLEAKSQWKDKPMEGSLIVELKLFFKKGGKHDIDNFSKIILDSLNGIVYEDDGQIEQMTVTKFIDKNNPRAEIEVIQLLKQIT